MSQPLPPFVKEDEVIDRVDCSMFLVYDEKDRCDFVMKAAGCTNHAGVISYLNMIYCVIGKERELSTASVVCLLIFFLMISFSILGNAADSRLCPAFQMLSKLMKMSEVMAGVTLVALGNCAPDLFTSIFSAGDPSRAVYSDLFSGSLLVTSIAPGVIMLIAPYQMHSTGLLRDVGFLLLGTNLINLYVAYGPISYYHCAGMILIYVAYIVVVIIDQWLLSRDPESDEDVVVDMERRKLSIFHTGKFSLDLEGKNNGLLLQLINSVNPIDPEEWSEASKVRKVIMIIRSPFILTINLSIPMTDFEADNDGWSKLLNCMQLVTMPQMIIFLMSDVREYTYYISAGMACITLPFAIYCFIVTRVDKPPKFHWIFALYASTGAIVVISIGADEICELIYVLGLICGVSSSFLGATILAWGNSIGDLVADIILAMQGFQSMGLAAAFGAPVFNLLLTMGITFIVIIYERGTEDGKITVNKGEFGEGCCIYFIMNNFLLLVWASLLDFQGRRSMGVLSLVLYVSFLVSATLTEFHIIDSYSANERSSALYWLD